MRSKILNLSRILEYGYFIDVKNKGLTLEPLNIDKSITYVERAYEALLSARKYRPDDEVLDTMTKLVGEYARILRGGE